VVQVHRVDPHRPELVRVPLERHRDRTLVRRVHELRLGVDAAQLAEQLQVRRTRPQAGERLVGRGRALEILLSADDYDADLAERYGWINRALPEAELADAVRRGVVAPLVTLKRTRSGAARTSLTVCAFRAVCSASAIFRSAFSRVSATF
jgi:regulator of protease activity HflC (stomatin/prohibitin superfamily)